MPDKEISPSEYAEILTITRLLSSDIKYFPLTFPVICVPRIFERIPRLKGHIPLKIAEKAWREGKILCFHSGDWCCSLRCYW